MAHPGAEQHGVRSSLLVGGWLVRIEVVEMLERRVLLAFERSVVGENVVIPIPATVLAPGRYMVRGVSEAKVATHPFVSVR